VIDIDNFFNNDAIMSSLVTNLNSSTAQEIVKWVTNADGCVHTADATRRVGGAYWALLLLLLCGLLIINLKILDDDTASDDTCSVLQLHSASSVYTSSTLIAQQREKPSVLTKTWSFQRHGCGDSGIIS